MASQEPGSQMIQWHYGEVDDKNFQLRGRSSSILLLVVVVALLIFFILICLYAKWACRLATVAAVSDHRPAPAPRRLALVVAGLDRETIDSFPVHVMSAPADEAQCPICLCNLVEGEKVKVLPGCSHGFHPECVDEWLKGQSSCPLCRASLTPAASPHQPAALV
uniref:RING-H2 finger protein ATL66 n=1 Tax=Anthurium amnicola TaxID=1678845 RepID=A0A1D1Y8J2_9ARAE